MLCSPLKNYWALVTAFSGGTPAERPAEQDPSTSSPQWASDIAAVRAVLERAFPPAGKSFPARLHSTATGLLRYVGLPALAIAAVLPVYELVSGVIEHRNRGYVRQTYARYAEELLGRREYGRARSTLDGLREASVLDVDTYYATARVLAEAAFRQGRGYQETEDRVRILLRLHADRPWLFPRFGGDADIVDLEARLIDVTIARKRPQEALEDIATLRGRLPSNYDPRVVARLLSQEGRALADMHRFRESRASLGAALLLLQVYDEPGLKAETLHSVGTLLFFEGDNPGAIAELLRAKQIFETIGDAWGVRRCHANLALAFGGALDWDAALLHRQREEAIAREQGDQLGLATALVGLAMIRRNKGQLDESLRLAMEAEAAFAAQGHGIGLATALQNQANAYSRMEKCGQALVAAKNAVDWFAQERDVRGVAASLGVIGRCGLKLRDLEEAIYGLLGSIVLNRSTGLARSEDGARDELIHTHDLIELQDDTPVARFADAIRGARVRLQELAERMRLDPLEWTFSR